ncbi:hypothetical protein [Pseudactinotalea terrae]|uniref:hypothetical protein n=1 Tax=Pseudactinotalea terrae TaxID=1743262 RepID=UPI0012E25DBC|nr:hypothetical protein [Pseudactinotalea terrae]
MRGLLTRAVTVAAFALATLTIGALPASADAGEPPVDPGDDWTLASSREDPSTSAEECSTASEWVWSSAEAELTLLHVPCTDSAASSGIYEWLAPAGDPVGGASEEGEAVHWGQDSVTRAWITDGGGDDRGLAVLTVGCAGRTHEQCTADTHELMLMAMGALPGGIPGVDTPGFNPEAIVLGLIVPVVLIALVVAPFRLVTMLARARYTSSSTSPRYHDVARIVTKARWLRLIRRLAWSAIGFVLVVGGLGAAAGDLSILWGTLLICAIPVIVLIIGQRTFLKPSPVERGRANVSGQGVEAGVGATLSVLSYALVLLVLVVYVLLTLYGGMSAGWPSLTSEDVRRMDLPLLANLRSLVTSLGSDAIVTATLLVIPALILVAMVDGLGQRLRTASLDEALSQDTRPHYLYLRSFDEDKLAVVGQLRRRSLIAALSLRRKVRFEEVMVRQLSATGPVIAIAPPGSNMPPIGAARASFSNDEWQQHVHRYAETARAVVLSATPGEIRQGYGWELDLIANRISHQRVLVVLGPWSLSSLRRRWTQFCMAVSAVPFFAPITMPWVPDGIHVLAHSTQRGWQGWGATRRSDWTYSVAIDQATREYLPDWS